MIRRPRVKDLKKLIEGWQEEFPKDKYVVRGHSKIYGEKPGEKKISSTLYRQVKKEKGREITSQELLREERKLAALTRMRSLPLIGDVEILSDLQHFGAPTNCIDFTRDIYIALFFACSKDENPGELVFLRHDRTQLALPQHFKLPTMAPEAPRMEMLVPSTTDMDKNRSLFQQSLFVRDRRGFCDDSDTDICVRRIEAAYKPLFRNILLEHNVSHFSLFNDTLGLASLGTQPVQGNWLDSIKMPDTDFKNWGLQEIVQRGTVDYCEANYQRAIQGLGKAILIEPDDKLYRLRGSAYLCNGDYEKALEDIGQVSEAAWNDRDYFLMAIAHYELGSIGHSLRAINNAIGFNPYRTIYHHFRIMLRELHSEKPSAQPDELLYLEQFVEDPDVSRIVSEKIIDTEEFYRSWGKT